MSVGYSAVVAELMLEFGCIIMRVCILMCYNVLFCGVLCVILCCIDVCYVSVLLCECIVMRV